MSNVKILPEVGEALRRTYANEGIVGFRRAQAERDAAGGEYWKAAQNYARVGEQEKAIEALLSAYEKSDFDLIYFGGDPVFDQMYVDLDDRLSGLWGQIQGQ